MPRRAVAILCFLSLAIALARLAFLRAYPEWDQSTYFLIGDAIIHGKQLYAQIWDMKPPAIFATYAIANLLTRSSFEWTGYLLSIISAIGTTIAVYFAGVKLNRNAGLLAAGFFALVAIEPALEGMIPNTESFINLFIAIGFAIWIWRSDRVGGAILAGCGFALATLYKQVALAPALMLAIANIAAPISGRRRATICSAIFLAPTFLAWLLVFAYFAATGRAWIFWQTNFVYARYYGGSVLHNLLNASLFDRHMLELSPLAGLGLVGAIVIAFLKFTRDKIDLHPHARAAIVALLVGQAIAIALPGQHFVHYQQLWLIPISLCAAWGATLIFREFARARPSIVAIVAVVMLGLIILQAHWYFLSPIELAKLQRPASTYPQCLQTGEEIRAILRSNESMYCWCDETYLYVIANKRPPAAGLWKYHMVAGPVARWLTQRTIEDLNRNPPDLIVTWQWSADPMDQPIDRWMSARYDPLPNNLARAPLALFARRGSELHQRVFQGGEIDAHK